MLTPGTVLQNRYRVVGQLGKGGMGTVYEAHALRLDTTVALKETHFTDERLRKQFEREAQLLAGLRHPALPRVTDHFDEGDGLYLVMDYVEGDDLWAMLQKRGGPFPVGDVLKWAGQLLDALAYMHAQEPPVIHRDIKPQNLKLTRAGQIILLDFGLAKGFAGQLSRVTTSGSIFGYTPSYSPLEQIQGTGTDGRSDLYSLGATLYNLVTGKVPPDVLTRLTATTDGEPDPLLPADRLNSQVPESVAGILSKAMSVGRSQRYASAAEMREALRRAAHRDGASDNDGHEPDGEEETRLRNGGDQAVEFVGDDRAYLRWLGEHPAGYVLNTPSSRIPSYMVLHRAKCPHVSRPDSIPSGGFTERLYIKVCAPNVEQLRAWAVRHGRADGSFSGECGSCRPLDASAGTDGPGRGGEDGDVARIDEPVVAININQQFPYVRSAEDLYNVTRSMWRVRRERADRARYVFSVYQGVIKEVYTVDRWKPATEETIRYWQERNKSQSRYFPPEVDYGRSEFVGEVAPEAVRDKYVGKRLPKRSFGSPILYFNC